MRFHCGAVLAIAAWSALLGLTSGCGSGAPPRVYADKPDSRSGQRAIELYGNKDGYIDANGLEKAPGLKAAMRQIDRKHAGKISADDISARINAWSTKVSRMALSCHVTHNGKPLAGAKVKFVPESFLGDGMKSYEGTTTEHGVAHLSMAGSTQPGVSPGFYRVEITKPGETIPAKYNTETSLGQEVAEDAAGIASGAVVIIDLKY